MNSLMNCQKCCCPFFRRLFTFSGPEFLIYLPRFFPCIFSNSETPVVEKEVVEVDAPKVVDEENEAVENGNGEEAAAPAESTENGTTEESEAEPAEEVTSAEETVDVQNGDSTGKLNMHTIIVQEVGWYGYAGRASYTTARRICLR